MTPVLRLPQEKPISPQSGNEIFADIVTIKNNDSLMIHLYAHLTSKKIDHENDYQKTIDPCIRLFSNCLP
jgi:hypothetical protein